ncbi:MAG: helix-turn-helix domain-containing protein [Candidatus Omnitrophota bacterium]|nr:helix-turn-helix domain-containing protein [Candidatus Omnitrophota bacterium]MBU2528996.1 helix-turn-helix domain-containing protein [bacterium]MBU3929847.1 helix-turn-helix domain-containing protein [bacterium]
MKKVDDYIKDKIKKDPGLALRCELTKQKVKVVQKIIEYRNKHKLSQAQLAKKLNVTQQYISKIEEGNFSNLTAVENLLYRIGYKLQLEVVKIQKKKEAAHTSFFAQVA